MRPHPPKLELIESLRRYFSRLLQVGPFEFVAVDWDEVLQDAHQISDAVEKAIQNAYPGAEVIIHQDPAGLEPLPPDFS